MSRSRSPRLAATVFVLASASAVSSPPAIAAPRPVENRTIVVVRVSGTVSVLEPGARSPTSLGTHRRAVKLGSVVDASHGMVELTAAANGHRNLQTGDFTGAAFTVEQVSKGRTVLTLVGPSEAGSQCATASARALFARSGLVAVDSLYGKTPASRRHRGHHAHRAAYGRVDVVGFEVRGADGASRVSGAASWTTTDTCNTTEVSSGPSSERNAVHATSGAPNGEQAIEHLEPGSTVTSECSSSPALYCVYLLSENKQVKGGVDASYGAGLVTVSTSQVAELCVRGPTGQQACATYPLSPQNDASGVAALASCLPFEGAGEYAINWRVGGAPIGGTLVYKTNVLPFEVTPCETTIGKWLHPGEDEHLSELNAPYKFVNREFAVRAGNANAVEVELGPTGRPGTQLIRGVVYADEGGKPGKLLGETKILSFTQKNAYEPGYVLAFDRPVPIPAGTVWVGLSTGGAPNVAGYTFTSVAGSRAKNGGPSAVLSPDTPSDPFGEPEQGHGIDDRDVTLSLDYLD
jgi:hypothetical protein